jgi:hypothetical protein
LIGGILRFSLKKESCWLGVKSCSLLKKDLY